MAGLLGRASRILVGEPRNQPEWRIVAEDQSALYAAR
jgi:hypothetical protein